MTTTKTKNTKKPALVAHNFQLVHNSTHGNVKDGIQFLLLTQIIKMKNFK